MVDRQTYYTGIRNDGTTMPWQVWINGRIWFFRRTQQEAEAELRRWGKVRL